MNIFSKIKSLFKKPDTEMAQEDPCIVQRNLDGKYAIRKRDSDGSVWYLKVKIKEVDTDNNVLSVNPTRYEWEYSKYCHPYDGDNYWCIWTTDIQSLSKILNYKETKVEGVNE